MKIITLEIFIRRDKGCFKYSILLTGLRLIYFHCPKKHTVYFPYVITSGLSFCSFDNFNVEHDYATSELSLLYTKLLFYFTKKKAKENKIYILLL